MRQWGDHFVVYIHGDMIHGHPLPVQRKVKLVLATDTMAKFIVLVAALAACHAVPVEIGKLKKNKETKYWGWLMDCT